MRMRHGGILTTRAAVMWDWRSRIPAWKRSRANIIFRVERDLNKAYNDLETVCNDGTLSSHTETRRCLESAQDGIMHSLRRLYRYIREGKEASYASAWCVDCRNQDACDCHVLPK